MTAKKKKQSLLTGALASSFGIFIAKALGLFYVVPLANFAGDNMAFYSIAYTYYDLLLKITQAGVPFAIAALVAKYLGREDYKTALIVKKIGYSFVMAVSFVVGVIFLFIARPLAFSSLGSAATIKDIAALTNTLYLLFIAIISVPFLSAIRGYYQGLKRLDIFAASQVLEQFIRVFFIVAIGFFLVKILHFESIYAVYTAILAAGIAAVVTIGYLWFVARKDDQYLHEKAAQQGGKALQAKDIFREIMHLGIPYILISFLGTLAPLINSRYFLPYASYLGMDYVLAKKVLGIVLLNCGKLASIPQVLTLGFSAGLVPYLSEIYEKKDYVHLRLRLDEIFGTVLFILVPIVTAMIVLSRPIYYVMFGLKDLDLGAELLSVYGLVAFTDTIAPIFSSILITLRFRRNAILFLLIGTAVKTVIFFAGIPLFGYRGMIYSTAISSITVISLCLILLKYNFHFAIRKNIVLFAKTFLASILAITPIYLFQHFHGFALQQRWLCLLELALAGMILITIYALLTFQLQIPQRLFHMKMDSWSKLWKKISSRL